MGCNRRNDDSVLGAFDRDGRRRRRDFTFDARITIDRDDFCRAVDRCNDDRVAGVEDRNDDRRRRCGWSWI